MKTSDSWWTSIDSLESPIEQADNRSRSPQPSSTYQSKAHAEIRRQRRKVLPVLIGSAVISGLSLLGLVVFLVSQTPPFSAPQPEPYPSEALQR